MKKTKYLLLIPLLVLGIINQVKSQSQSEIWSLADKTFQVGQLNPLGNLPLGDANAFLIDYPIFSQSNPNIAQQFVYDGEKPVYSQNMAYDENGHIKFFIIDGNVYDHEGILIANSVLNPVNFDHYNFFIATDVVVQSEAGYSLTGKVYDRASGQPSSIIGAPPQGFLFRKILISVLRAVFIGLPDKTEAYTVYGQTGGETGPAGTQFGSATNVEIESPVKINWVFTAGIRHRLWEIKNAPKLIEAIENLDTTNDDED